MTGIAERAIRQAAEWWGTAKTSFLMHARGIEQHSHGVTTCLASINIVLASGRIGRPGCGYSTITGQGNGQGGREHGQKCDQLPGGRDIENPEHRRHVAAVWGIAEEEMPRAGVDCYEMFRKVESRRDQGAACPGRSTRSCRCRTAQFIKRMLEKLEFFACVDFFLSETARFADVVLPGSQHEEDEGVVCSTEGRVIKINQAVEPPGDAKQDWRILQDIAKALGRERGFTFASPREIFDELRRASPAASRTTRASPTRRSRRSMGVFWPCPSTDRGRPARSTTPAPRGCSSRGRGTRWRRGPGRSTSPTARPASTLAKYAPPTEDVDADYPGDPDHRPRGEHVPERQPDAADRPAGGPVPRAAPGVAPASWPRSTASPTATG